MSVEDKLEAMDRLIESYGAHLDTDEEDMLRMYREDLKDLKKIRTLIKNRKFKEAWKKARGLDTAVREEIPDNVYEFLEHFE
jgi:ribosomal protein L32E